MKTNRRISLADPILGDEEKRALAEVIDDNWLTMGDRVRAFEEAFARLHGQTDAVAVSSCTAALHLALQALGVGPGDEVLVPSMTFVATANAVLYAGARPVLADILGLDTPHIHPQTCARLVNSRTRAAIVMHYGGYVADMDAWRRFCDGHGLFLLEDAAHAPGVAPVGQASDAACFSFFPNKNMTTAEGGMILARDPDILAAARNLRCHGMTRVTLDRHKGHGFSYDVVALGYNYRMDELRAAIGLVQVAKLPEWNRRRSKLAGAYRHLLAAALPGVLVPFNPEAATAAHIMPVLLPAGADRTGVMASLLDAGVQTSIHYPPLHLFSHHRKLFPDVSLPNTEEYGRRVLTLPLHPGMADEDADFVVQALRRALDTAPGQNRTAAEP